MASKAAAKATAPPAPPPVKLLPVGKILEHALAVGDDQCAVLGIIDTVIDRTMRAVIEQRIQSLTLALVPLEAMTAILSAVELRCKQRDSGEADEVVRNNMSAHNWDPEPEPEPCPIDRWARHVLPSTVPATATDAMSLSVSVSGTSPASVSRPLSPVHARNRTVTNGISRTPLTAHRPTPSTTATLSPILASATQATAPYPIPSPKSQVDESQRLALLVTLRQQQTLKARLAAEAAAASAEAREVEARKMAELKSQRARNVTKQRQLAIESATSNQSVPAAIHNTSTTITSSKSTTKSPVSSNKPAARAPVPLNEFKEQTEPEQRPQQRERKPLGASLTRTLSLSPKKLKQPKPPPEPVDEYTGVDQLYAMILGQIAPSSGVTITGTVDTDIRRGSELVQSSLVTSLTQDVEDESWAQTVSRMTLAQYKQWNKERNDRYLAHPSPQSVTVANSNTGTAEDGRQQSRPLSVKTDRETRTEEKEQIAQMTSREPVVIHSRPRPALTQNSNTNSGGHKQQLSFDSQLLCDHSWGQSKPAPSLSLSSSQSGSLILPVIANAEAPRMRARHHTVSLPTRFKTLTHSQALVRSVQSKKSQRPTSSSVTVTASKQAQDAIQSQLTESE